MRACEKFGPSAEKLGSNPHFGAILAFFGRRKGYFLSAQLTLGPSFLSLCCAVVIPLAAYTHSIKSSDNNSRFLSAGSKGLWRGAGERFFLGSGQSQLLKQITTTAFIFRPQWLPQPSSAFFGLLRAFHAATLHHTAKRRLDHIQQPTGWHLLAHCSMGRAQWTRQHGRNQRLGVEAGSS